MPLIDGVWKCETCGEMADSVGYVEKHVLCHKKMDELLLQNEVLQKDLAAAHEILKARDTRADAAKRLIEEKNRALFNIINVIGPTSAAKCEGCLFEMEEALRIARAAFEDKPIEKRNVSIPTERPFTREMFEALRDLPHPPELDKPNPEDKDL